tara:strand:+ start:167 stop:1591 length:1425 start_codon:yes stop_codon:yes gene_type:complete
MQKHQLPKGWAFSEIQNLTSANGLISDGDWIESKDQNPNGSIRLIQLADIGDGDFRNKSNRFMSEDKATLLNCTLLEAGDVLVARMPDPLGRACLFPGIGQPAVTVVDVCLIRVGTGSALTNQLLKYWINSPSFRGLVLENASGTTRKRITRKKLEKFEIPVPPLAEQKVIADKLDTLLAQVENTKARLERIPKILKRFRQSVLAAAVSGRLTESFRETDPYREIAERYLAPSEWDYFRLGGFTEFITSGSRGWAKYYSDSGSLFIRSQDINSDELDITDPCYVDLPKNAEGQRTKVQKNDLLVTITGANVTKCARVHFDLENAYVSQHVSLIRLNDTALAPFVELALKAPNAGRYQLLKSAYGGGKPGLNLKNIKDVQIALPKSEEMAEIVRQVDQLFAHADRIEQQVNKALARVNNLTQSILAKAFRGELTKQWRKDNPELISGENSAEALLERVKAERAASQQPKRRKRKA